MAFSDTAYSEVSHDLCRDWSRFDPKRCRWWKVIANSVDEVMEAKGLKFDHYNYSYGPQTVTIISSTLSRIAADPRLFGSTSLVLEYYHRPKLIYCEYAEVGKYQRQSDIWMRQISPQIGSLVVFSCFLFAASITYSQTKSAGISVRWLLRTLLGNLASTLTIFLRQSGSYQHKVLSILMLEFASVFFTLIYENSILHDLVIPRPKLIYGNINELMEANYTYLFDGRVSAENDWIQKVYRTRSMIPISNCCDDQMLKELFWKRSDGVKFVLNDDGTERQFLIQRLNVLIGYKYPCHAISPSESVFASRAYFTAYLSPVGDYFVEAHNHILSVGFRASMDKWIAFRRELEFALLQRDIERNDPEWKLQNEINQKQLLAGEYITIFHWTAAIRWAVISSAVSITFFVFEVYRGGRISLRYFILRAEITINQVIGTVWLRKLQE